MVDPSLAAEQRQRLAAICDRFAVDILYVFGSRSQAVYRWMAGELPLLPPSTSDIDIGVYPSASVHHTVSEKVALTQALEELLVVPRVDLVWLPSAPPFLALNVIRGERLYARDERRADEYDLYVLRRAGDLHPLHQERIDLVLGKKP